MLNGFRNLNATVSGAFCVARRKNRGANEYCFIQGLYDSYSLIYKEAKWQESSPAAGPS